MPLNFDGRSEVRIFYQTLLGGRNFSHRHTFDVEAQIDAVPIGVSFNQVVVEEKGGAETSLQAFVDAYMALILPFYNATTTFTTAELWKYDEGSTDGVFVSAYALGLDGTSGFPDKVAHQATFTFRSALGGTMRLQFMESGLPDNSIVSYPTGNTAVDALIAFVIGSDSAIVARDNARPIAAMRASYGQNEKLWRKRFRSE